MALIEGDVPYQRLAIGGVVEVDTVIVGGERVRRIVIEIDGWPTPSPGERVEVHWTEWHSGFAATFPGSPKWPMPEEDSDAD